MTPGPEAPPRKRRWLRRLTIVVVAACVLLSAAFLLRKPLFSGLALSILRSEISGQLGVPVSVRALEGDWWNTFELQGLSFENAKGPVTSVSDATITVRLDPLQAIRDGLGGLRSLHVQAARVRVSLSPSSDQKHGAKDPGPPPSLEEILTQIFPLFPDGVEVQVAELALGTRSGKASVALAALGKEARATRKLSIQGPDLELEVEVGHAEGEAWSLSARGKLGGLGAVATDLGSHLPIQDGNGTFDAVFDSTGRARGSVEIRGLTWRGQALQTTRLEFGIQEKKLQIPSLDVELPGLRILAKDLVLPTLSHVDDLHPALWNGTVDIRIQDLEPYRDRLPEEIRRRLPIQGSLAGRLASGSLVLSKASLRGKGFEAKIDQGRLPIFGDLRKQSGELQGRVEFTKGMEITVDRLGKLALGGFFEGRVTGSLGEPTLDGNFDVEGRTAKGVIQVKGHARSARNRHSIEEMSLAMKAGTEMQLAGRFEFDSLATSSSLEVRGNFDSTALETLGLLPTLPRHVVCPDLRTKATLTLGRSLGLEASLSMEGIQSQGLPVGGLSGLVSWKGGEEIAIREFEIRPARQKGTESPVGPTQGNVLVQAKGTIPLAVGRIWDLQVEGSNLSLDFVGPFVGQRLPRSRLDLSAKVMGSFESPHFSIDTGGFLLQHPSALLVALSDEQVRHLPQLPLRFRARIEARSDRIHVERLDLSSGEGSEMLKFEGHGNLPFGTQSLSKELGTNLFQAKFHWRHETAVAGSVEGSMHIDQKGLALGPLEIQGPYGNAKGELRADFPVQDLLAGKAGKDQVRLAGKLDLQRVDLGKIPRAFIKDLDVSGLVDGEFGLGGSLARPEPRMRLRLDQVGLKIRGAPRVDSLSGEIVVQPRAIRVQKLDGKIGVSDFAITGGLETKGLLWTDFEDANLGFGLKGEDLMLVRSRGMRLLGNSDLRLTGTPRKMTLSGDIAVVSGKYNERQSLLMIDPSQKGGATLPGFVPFQLEGELGKRLDFDVKLRTENPFLVRTGLVDADVNAQLRLRGPGSKPWLVGAVTALRGWIRMPAAKLRLEQALIFFKEDQPFFPELNVSAVYRRKGHEIRMRVQGTYDNPALLLSSSPHLEYEQILVFLSTGQLPKDLAGRAMESTLLAAGSYGANELWSWLIDTGSTDDESESFFDRFSFESGQDYGRSGVESMRVEYRLGPQWFVQVERDADGFYNMGLVFRISF